MTKILIYPELDVIEELREINSYHYNSSWSTGDNTRHGETSKKIRKLIEHIEKAAEVVIKEGEK